jgi:hypothetical protein
MIENLKKCRKGFIFSVIAISFMMLLMALAVTMSNEYWETERVVARPQPLTYATATLENIGAQFANVVLPSASVRSGNVSLRINIADSLPRGGIGSELNTLKSYVEDELADSLHADISVNITKVNNKKLDLVIANGFLYNSSNYSFTFRPIANASSSGATNYSLNFSVNEYRNTVNDFGWDAGGAMNVTVRFTDKNGTVETSGLLDPDEANTLTVTYGENETENVEVNIGRVSKNGNYYDGALWMNLSNSTSTSFSFSANLPLQPTNASNRMVFPIEMDYSQGGVFKMMNATR